MGHDRTPYTNGTDAWATVANQTPNGSAETNRLDYNVWIRDGAPIDSTTKAPVAIGAAGLRAGQAGHPLAGYIDAADLGESARNSGKWKAGYTSDGLHPNAVGAAGMKDGGGRTVLGAILGATAT